MRIKVTLKVRKLPILYRHRLMALIKEVLELADSGYKDSIYPENLKITKPFTFSVFIPPGFSQRKERFIVDEDIAIEDTVLYPGDGKDLSFFVSSSDYEFIINLYNGLLKLERFKITDFLSPDDERQEEFFQIGRVFLLNERKITGSEVMFKTMSPLSVEDENDRPINIFHNKDRTINNDELERLNYHLNAIQERRLRALRGYGLKRPLTFIPVKLKNKGIKHTLRGFRKQTGKPYMVLTTYQGTFCLKGDPEDLQFIYQTGLGLRTGQGFGMIDLA